MPLRGLPLSVRLSRPPSPAPSSLTDANRPPTPFPPSTAAPHPPSGRGAAPLHPRPAGPGPPPRSRRPAEEERRCAQAEGQPPAPHGARSP